MIKRFLDYVEIRTKITSIFAFSMTIAYLLYSQEKINIGRTILFFASMFLFDLTTTAINNYIDTKNNGQILQFKRNIARIIIYVLLGSSTIMGLYLAYLTDIVILLIGGVCFLCGVLYTYGPIPISRQPLGEILSGLFYGLLIPFIILYINMPKGSFLLLECDFETITLEFKIVPILILCVFSMIPICTTANIMLANNICDLEKDIKVKRYTLPYYIGKSALHLYANLYYLTYIATIVMVIFNIVSPICLLSLITIIPVQKNIKAFIDKQEKSTTFILSIKNYILIMGANTLLIFISSFFVK